MGTREVNVLLVEDSPEERRLIDLELSEIEEPRFCIKEAARLSEAEAELRKFRTDVVLLDLSLPDSGGLTGLIRLCQEFPALPVVVFTGLDDQEIALQALREGGQDFLVKGKAEPGVLKRVLLHAIERKRVDVALNDSRESLREAQRLETLGRLAGKIAHDFNNILTTIVGFSDLLLEDLQGHPCVEDILEIKKAGERGATLTSHILAFARREQPNLDALDMAEAVHGVSGMLGQLLPKTITLEMEAAPDLPHAMADLGQVEQALVNLVVNARDAMPSGGTVRVKTDLVTLTGAHTGSARENSLTGSTLPPPGRYVTVSVEDTGSGIDSETLDRIFEPFFTTKPRGAGTGLGLSTVISIVKGCGGGVEVNSVVGEGTRFILYFPVFSQGGAATTPRVHPGAAHVAASGLDIPLVELRSAPLDPEGSREPGSTEDGSLAPDEEEKEHLEHLYYIVSHDFHEPLRMVSSYLGLLRRRGREKLEAELQEFIDYAVDGCHRMQEMLDGVLRYSRCLKAEPISEPTEVGQVFEHLLQSMPEVRDVVSWQGQQPTLYASANHLTNILRELLSNALKFADPEAPAVSVNCRSEGDDWLFEVVDNGPGVPQEEGAEEKVFRLFGRLHGRDEYPGLGVGLAIAQCLASKYEAEFTLPPGPGGRVLLRWPSRVRTGEEVAGV
jgi:two-component system cell cycle sensor histidine kinase/response regulator CckA